MSSCAADMRYRICRAHLAWLVVSLYLKLFQDSCGVQKISELVDYRGYDHSQSRIYGFDHCKPPYSHNQSAFYMNMAKGNFYPNQHPEEFVYY
jgi:hypothetical protein